MATFFSDYPLVTYQGKPSTDLLFSFHLSRIKIESLYIFQKYSVASGETPEMVCNALYKDPQLIWVIFLLNNIVNPYKDWVKSDEALKRYVQEVYKNLGGENGIHHFVNILTSKKTDTLSKETFLANPESLPEFIKPITNFEHEKEINETKRFIDVINPDYIFKFLEQCEEIIKNGGGR